MDITYVYIGYTKVSFTVYNARHFLKHGSIVGPIALFYKSENWVVLL